MSKFKIVVIGNGMVGHKFIETLAVPEHSNIELITVCEAPKLAYDRVQLSSYFSGNSAEDLALTSEAEYDESGVKYYLNDRVGTINSDDKQVVTKNGVVIDYDKLILAMGSTAFVPPIPGNDQSHIHVYRTLEDLDDIRKSSEE